MKKLMIAMSAATMAALCAQAADTKVSGVNFENLEVGALDTTADDAGTSSGTKYWLGDGEVDSQIVKGAADEANETQYLKVDETEFLTRTINGKDAEPTALPDAGGVYIKTKVQFTAADDEPKAVDGDKLLVWRKQIEDNPETTDKDESATVLMVTDKTKAWEVTDVDVNTTDWYDLEIRAKKVGEGARALTAFTVAINSTLVNDGQLFDSIWTSGDYKTSIASIGFKGTGAVDDIEFGTFTEATIPTVAISGEVTGYSEDLAVAFFGSNGVELAANPKVGDTITIAVAGAAATDTVTCDGVTFAWDGKEFWTAEYEVTAADGKAGKKDFAVKVAKGGEPAAKPEIVPGDGQTVEAAVAAANSATGIVVKNCTASDVTINGTTITVGTTTVTIPAYYTAKFDATASKITLTLNTNALEEETAVSVDAEKLGLTISTSKEKLYYGLATSTTVDAEQYTAPTKLVKGNGGTLTLTAEKNGNACFYRLYVTDIAPTAVK